MSPTPTSAPTATPRERRLRHAAARRVGGIVCVLERLDDRGNRAAVLRTAEALGLLNVHEVAPARPELGRARGVAHGGEKWLMMRSHATAAECVEALHADGCQQVLVAVAPPTELVSPSWHSQDGRRRRRRGQRGSGGSSSGGGGGGGGGGGSGGGGGGGGGGDAAPDGEGGATDDTAAAEPPPPPPPAHVPLALEAVDFSLRTALVFGNEKLGASAEMLRACDGAFTIPLHGLTESLNVSVAAALALHYGRVSRVAALRASAGGGALNAEGGDLDEQAVEALVAEYGRRGKHHAKGEGGGGGEGGGEDGGDAPGAATDADKAALATAASMGAALAAAVDDGDEEGRAAQASAASYAALDRELDSLLADSSDDGV